MGNWAVHEILDPDERPESGRGDGTQESTMCERENGEVGENRGEGGAREGRGRCG